MSLDPLPEIVALKQEIDRLQELVALQQNLLSQRSEPILTAVIDALANVSQLAQQGHQGAQQIVTAWKRSLRLAEEASTGIVIARPRTPGNGPLS